MLQSSSAESNNALTTRLWWESDPNTTAEPILKLPESRGGLASSRWAPASDDGKNAVPIERHGRIDTQAVGNNFSLEMGQEFSFNSGNKSISTSANATHPEVFGPSMGGMHNGFNTSVTQFTYGNFENVSEQPHSVAYDQPLDASYSFSSEIEMDDDGDVAMMDLSDPNTIMLIDIVARAEREAGTIGDHVDLKPVFRPTISSSRISNPSCVFVIDTNFILSHLQLVNNLALSHPRWRNVVVMPWATIQELDGLKKSTRQNEGVEVAKLARSAINWAYRSFKRYDPGVWAQIKQEKCDSDATYGDAAILDCCVYFQTQGHPTVLLSHDKNLCLQAMSYNISIVAVEGATKTAEDILFRFIPNSPNPQVMPVSNRPPASLPPVKRVSLAYSPGSNTLLPRMQNSDHTSTSFATYRAAPTYSPAPSYTPPTSRSANLTQQEVQTPFYQNPSTNVLHLQYGTKMTRKTSPNPSSGLHDSIYAPGNNSSVPNPRKYTIPSLKSPFGLYKPSFPRDTTVQDLSRKGSVDIKLGLKGLLQKISSELVINIVPLLKKCALEKLGSMDTLRHLNISPERQVHSILDMERFLHTHWMTVFTEIFPDNLQHVFYNADLNQRYTRWIYWTEFSGSSATGPLMREIRKWIEELDLIWKRLIYTEREAMVNMSLVDGWRVALTRVGLSDD